MRAAVFSSRTARGGGAALVLDQLRFRTSDRSQTAALEPRPGPSRPTSVPSLGVLQTSPTHRCHVPLPVLPQAGTALPRGLPLERAIEHDSAYPSFTSHLCPRLLLSNATKKPPGWAASTCLLAFTVSLNSSTPSQPPAAPAKQERNNDDDKPAHRPMTNPHAPPHGGTERFVEVFAPVHFAAVPVSPDCL